MWIVEWINEDNKSYVQMDLLENVPTRIRLYLPYFYVNALTMPSNGMSTQKSVEIIDDPIDFNTDTKNPFKRDDA